MAQLNCHHHRLSTAQHQDDLGNQFASATNLEPSPCLTYRLCIFSKFVHLHLARHLFGPSQRLTLCCTATKPRFAHFRVLRCKTSREAQPQPTAGSSPLCPQTNSRLLMQRIFDFGFRAGLARVLCLCCVVRMALRGTLPKGGVCRGVCAGGCALLVPVVTVASHCKPVA